MNDRRQTEGCNFRRSTVQCYKCSLLCVLNGQVRVEEPRYSWYCGTEKYRKGDGTGIVEKWYHGAAVVP